MEEKRKLRKNLEDTQMVAAKIDESFIDERSRGTLLSGADAEHAMPCMSKTIARADLRRDTAWEGGSEISRDFFSLM
ncbi:MAG: hypothetical protein LBR80_16490 [Deltaproteobacteria bacterium]|nr:hypothetical protein [Deltaproteobacteria bacterium]